MRSSATTSTNARVQKRGVPEGGEDGSSVNPKRAKNTETGHERDCDSDSKRDSGSKDLDSNPKSVTDSKLKDVDETVPTCSLQKVLVSKVTH